jgi:hypothetical protein
LISKIGKFNNCKWGRKKLTADILSIISNAEYIALSKNGRNSHRVNCILAKIYLLCGSGKLEEAKALIEVLYRVTHQEFNDHRRYA